MNIEEVKEIVNELCDKFISRCADDCDDKEMLHIDAIADSFNDFTIEVMNIVEDNLSDIEPINKLIAEDTVVVYRNKTGKIIKQVSALKMQRFFDKIKLLTSAINSPFVTSDKYIGLDYEVIYNELEKIKEARLLSKHFGVKD